MFISLKIPYWSELRSVIDSCAPIRAGLSLTSGQKLLIWPVYYPALWLIASSRSTISGKICIEIWSIIVVSKLAQCIFSIPFFAAETVGRTGLSLSNEKNRYGFEIFNPDERIEHHKRVWRYRPENFTTVQHSTSLAKSLELDCQYNKKHSQTFDDTSKPRICSNPLMTMKPLLIIHRLYFRTELPRLVSLFQFSFLLYVIIWWRIKKDTRKSSSVNFLDIGDILVTCSTSGEIFHLDGTSASCWTSRMVWKNSGIAWRPASQSHKHSMHPNYQLLHNSRELAVRRSNRISKQSSSRRRQPYAKHCVCTNHIQTYFTALEKSGAQKSCRRDKGRLARKLQKSGGIENRLGTI